MFRLFRVVKEEGEDALRRTVWMLCAALLLITAIGFIAAATAFALSTMMPMWASLLISAGGILAISLVCLVFADRDHHHSQPPAQPAPSPMTSLFNSGLVDRTTQALLLEKVKTRPASVLAIAAAAGLAVAALDAFDDD